MSEEVKLSKSAKDKEKQAQDEAKLKTLETVLGKIEKTYGKGAVMNMAARPTTDVNVIPTGSINLDHALGVGGYPRGRIIEIYGPESSGKTTLAIHAIAEVQKQGGKAIIIDAEHAFDPSYAEALGVDMDSLYISQPDNGEQALDIAEQVIRSGAVDLLIIGSVAALVPKQEIEGEMGETKVGLQARLMSQALRKITGAISKSNTACIFINQLREKIGGNSYGPSETTTGGNALKFYASVRLDIRRIGQLKDGDEVIGNNTRVKVVKNKVAPPFRVANFEILYGQGISRLGEIIDIAESEDFIKKSGSWYSYGATKLGQGKENAKQTLADNPELLDEVRGRVRSSIVSSLSTPSCISASPSQLRAAHPVGRSSMAWSITSSLPRSLRLASSVVTSLSMKRSTPDATTVRFAPRSTAVSLRVTA